MKFLPLLLITASALILPSCSNMGSMTGGSGLRAYQAYDQPATKPTNPSAVRVKVSTSRQRVYVMEGNKALLVMPVSVGTTSTPTPKGNFTISKKDHYHRASDHGYAYAGGEVKKIDLSERPSGWSFKGTPMPYWCEFKTNYGFHTGWVKHSPCTNGCIRMHENLAPKFYALVKKGTPVNISTSQPEDSQYGNIPLAPDAGPLPDYPDSFYVGNDYFTRHKEPTYN